jgi:hypothetical protein
MIGWENDLTPYEQHSVAATFSAQLDRLARESPDVSSLLKVLSCFDPENIAIGMIIKGVERLPERSTIIQSHRSVDGSPAKYWNRGIMEMIMKGGKKLLERLTRRSGKRGQRYIGPRNIGMAFFLFFFFSLQISNL